MSKYRHTSMHKIVGPPNLVLFDGEESKLQKRIFREHSTDKIKFCWESTPMNRVNDFNFQKINNVNKDELDNQTKDSYLLPQIHKRKNLLQNEQFVISPQTTSESELKFGKYAKRYTQDSDLFSLKIPTQTHYVSNSSSYGQFYFKPDIKIMKTKPCFTYHTAKSQILGNSRLEYIKLRQEID